MNQTALSFALLATACLAPATTAQRIALLEGPSLQSLDLRLLDEQNPTAAGQLLLQQIEIRPIEITGRTVLQDYETARARRVARNGLWRVELPGGGRLLQYRRLNGQFWGFLRVATDGNAQVVLEVAGGGTTGTDAPFHDRIAVAADGRHALAGLVAGGAYVVRLDGSLFPSTNAPSRLVPTPAPVDELGAMVGGTHSFYLTQDDRLWRLPLQDGGVPFAVSPPPTPNGFFKTELAMAGDGNAIVCLYGPRNLQSLWLVRTSGGPTLLPPQPSKYEEPDYLPEGSGHPALLLNFDGTRLFYVDAIARDELFLLDVPAAMPPLQITSDPIFQPYIGVHILPKFVGQALYVAIGDPNRMDWFRADAAGPVTNLTATGSALQPFPAGTLDPAGALLAGSALLTTEQAGAGALRLRRIDLQAGTSTVLYGDLAAPPTAGSAFTGAADLVVHGSTGDRLFLGSNGAQLAATPAGLLLTPPGRGPQYSATWLHLTSGFGLAVFFLPDGNAVAGPFEQGVSQLAMTQAGGCVILGQLPRYLAPGVFRLLNLPAAAVRICMSGADG